MAATDYRHQVGGGGGGGGPNVFCIKFPRRNVRPVLKCMVNYIFRALQLHDRYSDSQ